MVYDSPGTQARVAAVEDAAHEWRQTNVTLQEDGLRLTDAVLHALSRCGYPPGLGDRLRPALAEALGSALQVSQRHDPSRPARVAYRVGNDYALVEVEGRERGAAGPPGTEEAPVGERSYTWLRCERHTGQLAVCKYQLLP